MATEFFQEWRMADRVASAAEKKLAIESMSAIKGVGAVPSPATTAKAKRLRALADDLFKASMEEFRAKAFKFRRI
jgi:hypothetical protein